MHQPARPPKPIPAAPGLPKAPARKPRRVYAPASRMETKRRGELSELAFVYEAMRRDLGLRFYQPYGDSARYDWVIDNGRNIWRIQVKSTSNVISPHRYHVNAGRRLGLAAVPYRKSEIDFLVVHIVPDNAWYIFPLKAVGGRVTLPLLGPLHPETNAYTRYLEAWHLLV